MTSSQPDGIVIVGAGEAGARCALALRAKGHAGAVTLVGAEARTAYERPPLSKAVLTDDAEAPEVLSREQARAQAIDLRLGVEVAAIDADAHALTLADGDRLGYGRLVLATGASARPLAVPGGHHALLLRTDRDAAAIKARLRPGQRLVVIGGGFIGLEVAASASRRGLEVSVIELAPRLMGRVVPAAIAARMAACHRAAGIALHLGQGVEAIEPDAVRLASGERLPADMVVAGVGAIPNTGLAEAAGLAVDNGIAVDARMRTSAPDIFAIGDCCSFPHPVFEHRRIRLESWRNACDMAEHLAGLLTGSDEDYRAIPWFWSDQHDLGLQIAGLPDDQAPAVTRDLGDKGLIEIRLAPDGRVLAASGVGPGTAIAKDIRLLELMIAKCATPDPAALADPQANLKKLLRD